jgi:hypothetical protein
VGGHRQQHHGKPPTTTTMMMKCWWNGPFGYLHYLYYPFAPLFVMTRTTTTTRRTMHDRYENNHYNPLLGSSSLHLIQTVTEIATTPSTTALAASNSGDGTTTTTTTKVDENTTDRNCHNSNKYNPILEQRQEEGNTRVDAVATSRLMEDLNRDSLPLVLALVLVARETMITTNPLDKEQEPAITAHHHHHHHHDPPTTTTLVNPPPGFEPLSFQHQPHGPTGSSPSSPLFTSVTETKNDKVGRKRKENSTTTFGVGDVGTCHDDLYRPAAPIQLWKRGRPLQQQQQQPLLVVGEPTTAAVIWDRKGRIVSKPRGRALVDSSASDGKPNGKTFAIATRNNNNKILMSFINDDDDEEVAPRRSKRRHGKPTVRSQNFKTGIVRTAKRTHSPADTSSVPLSLPPWNSIIIGTDGSRPLKSPRKNIE